MTQGLYECLVMSFHLCNTPSTFMHFMTEILKSLLEWCSIIYFDDILHYNKSMEEHLQQLKEIYQTMKKNCLTLNLNKCIFLTTKVTFLCFIINGSGIHIDPEMIKVVVDWPTPTNIHEVRS